MSPSALPSRQSWAKTLFWQITYLTAAVVATTAGATAAFWLPLPQSGAQSGTGGEGASEILAGEGKMGRALGRPVNLLVMGIDEVPDTDPGSPESFASRSDTLLLLHLDPEQNGAAMLSIPRDTQVKIPGYGLTKINHANWLGGPAMARVVVSRNLNDVPVDRYVRVNTGALRAIVDALGGAKVFVPKPMYYVDNTQGLTIDLEEGWQVLNGEQAEQFARFRGDLYGDIGRVQRQQVLIKALRQRLTNPAIVARLPQLIKVAKDYTDTNLTTEELMALLRFGLQLSPETFQMVMLPGRASEEGEFNASYWLMDEAKRDAILSSYFDWDANAYARLDQTWDTEMSARSPYDLGIAVQNASDDSDQAYFMAQQLRELGFNNVYVVSDWPEAIDTTELIVQQGDLAGATLVRERLNLGRIESASTGDLESELTVRVGNDWRGDR